jgi:cell fate regulator YaaT (PSP1 superfamily)
MGKTVGIRFKSGCKIYDFDCGAFVLCVGDPVIVETEKGLAMGTVARTPTDKTGNGKSLKKVFRKATGNDFVQLRKNEEKERQAHTYCLKCINELGLEMSLFSVESTFDASRLTFFFTADGRVDFRQLVKMLVKELRARVEMRQVGIRNQFY